MNTQNLQLERSKRVRELAKVWSAISIAFVLVIAVGEVAAPHVEGDIPLFEWMLLGLFPVIPVIGLALAWRWELWGSLLALASLAAFFVVISIERGRFMPEITIFGLAVIFPTVLFLLCWNIERKEARLAG